MSFPVAPAGKPVLVPFVCMLILAAVFAAAEDEGVGSAAAEAGAAITETPEQFYVGDIKEAMRAYVASRVDEDGIFHIVDEVTGESLKLKFVKVHDPVRQIDDGTYFACTDFHVVGKEKKLYDLDFWMRPEGSELKVYEEKIHKEPRRSLLYGWYKHPRYTFVDDRVVEIY